MIRILRTAALAAGAVCAAANAPAGLIIEDSPSFVQPDENVLLRDDNAAALTTTGITNQTQTLVLFSQPVSPEEILSPSQGQARIDAVDGEFTSLRIQLENGLVFTELEANPHIISAGLSYTISAFDLLGTLLGSATFTSAHGQNYFGVLATEGTLIGWVDLIAPTNAIEDVRQVRIGGVQEAPEEGPPDEERPEEQEPVVPEPATIALMGLGGLGLLGGWRRRKAG